MPYLMGLSIAVAAWVDAHRPAMVLALMLLIVPLCAYC